MQGQDTIRRYLALSVLYKSGTAFTNAMYVTFLIGKGLDLWQVNLVNLVFYSTMFLAEIPTGAIADIYGRKLSFILACLLEAIGLFVYGFSGSFPGFALAEALIALGATCASGAFQAWLVDRLKHQGYKGSLQHVFTKENQIDYASCIFAGLFGAILADINPTLSWAAGGIMLLACLGLASSWMSEEYFQPIKYSIRQGFAEMIRTVRASVGYAATQRSVKYVLLIGLVQYFAVQAFNMQWQPHFNSFAGSQTALGIISAAMMLALIVGASLSKQFLKAIGEEQRALSWAQVLIGLFMVLTSVAAPQLLGVSFYLLHEIGRGMWRPLKDVYLNDNIPSKERATIISCESIMHHVGGAVGLLVSGYMANQYSISAAWMLSGMAMVLGTVLVSRLSHK